MCWESRYLFKCLFYLSLRKNTLFWGEGGDGMLETDNVQGSLLFRCVCAAVVLKIKIPIFDMIKILLKPLILILQEAHSVGYAKYSEVYG